MSQQIFLCRNTQLSKRRELEKKKSVETKEFPVTIEIAKDSKKSYRDKENSVAKELTG